MRYMHDTDAVTHLIKANPVLVKHVTATLMTDLCISAITKGELLFGLPTRPAARQLHAAVTESLKRVDVLPWNSNAAEHYGKLGASMEAQVDSLAPLDMLIGAHATSMGAVLVTNDQASKQIGDLQVEDWTVA